MRMASRTAMVMCALLMGTSVVADDNFYVSSQERGIDDFDHEVTEIKREDHYSVLRISDFQSRSASASRWMMCIYAELAIEREKSYLASVYSDNSGDEVYILFPASDSIDPAEYPDLDLDAADTRVMKTSVYRRFCNL